MTSTAFSKSLRVYTLVVLTVLWALLVHCGRRIWAGTLWLVGGPGADLALALYRATLRCRQQPTRADSDTCVTVAVNEPAHQ
jgi:hypothetical protein